MGWKIYFVIFATYLIIAQFDTPRYLHKTIYDYLNILMTIISLLGLHRFAANKAILSKRLWAYWFFMAASWHIPYEYYLRDIQLYMHIEYARSPFFNINSLSDLFAFLRPTIIRLPLFAGLYLYAFRSKQLWEEK